MRTVPLRQFRTQYRWCVSSGRCPDDGDFRDDGYPEPILKNTIIILEEKDRRPLIIQEECAKFRLLKDADSEDCYVEFLGKPDPITAGTVFDLCTKHDDYAFLHETRVDFIAEALVAAV